MLIGQDIDRSPVRAWFEGVDVVNETCQLGRMGLQYDDIALLRAVNGTDVVHRNPSLSAKSDMTNAGGGDRARQVACQEWFPAAVAA